MNKILFGILLLVLFVILILYIVFSIETIRPIFNYNLTKPAEYVNISYNPSDSSLSELIHSTSFIINNNTEIQDINAQFTIQTSDISEKNFYLDLYIVNNSTISLPTTSYQTPTANTYHTMSSPSINNKFNLLSSTSTSMTYSINISSLSIKNYIHMVGPLYITGNIYESLTQKYILTKEGQNTNITSNFCLSFTLVNETPLNKSTSSEMFGLILISFFSLIGYILLFNKFTESSIEYNGLYKFGIRLFTFILFIIYVTNIVYQFTIILSSSMASHSEILFASYGILTNFFVGLYTLFNMIY